MDLLVDKKGKNYIIEVNGNPGSKIDQICKDSDIAMEYITFVEENWKNEEYRSVDIWPAVPSSKTRPFTPEETRDVKIKLKFYNIEQRAIWEYRRLYGTRKHSYITEGESEYAQEKINEFLKEIRDSSSPKKQKKRDEIISKLKKGAKVLLECTGYGEQKNEVISVNENAVKFKHVPNKMRDQWVLKKHIAYLDPEDKMIIAEHPGEYDIIVVKIY